MPKTLKLISLGARGVGKTVFLISHCADALLSDPVDKQDSQWFECRDQSTKENVEKILAYMSQYHAYPPATFRISDFNLILKQHKKGVVKTLCEVDWVDIPGEWCTLDNSEFQSALLESHGCCVFVDANALLNSDTYADSLQQTIQQIEAIASLIDQNSLIQYPIALICTKYDLVHANSIGLIKLEEKLRPLIQKIKESQTLYQQFYSAIPLAKEKGARMIQKTNANKALFWLTSELNRIHGTQEAQNLGQVLNSIILNKEVSRPVNPESRKLAFSNPKKVITMTLAACGVVAGLSTLSLMLLSNSKTAGNSVIEQRISGFKKVLKTDPNNSSAISGIVDTYSTLGADEEAIAELLALHEATPNSIRLMEALALLYGRIYQSEKQEEYYDKILVLETNHLTALLGKAQLKAAQGEIQVAKEILQRAEKISKSPAFKAEIKRTAEQILNGK